MKKTPETITILPESDEQTLCLEVSGYVTREEHQEKLVAGLQHILDRHNTFNLLINYNAGYKGWEETAADSSIQSIIDFGKKARKLAYVNPPEKKIMQMKMTPDLFSGEVRFFAPYELNKAIAWIKS